MARRLRRRLVVGAIALLMPGCAGAPGEGATARQEGAGGAATDDLGSIAEVLQREFTRIDSTARVVDSIFKPLPLLTPTEEERLRSFGNAAQLERARRLGIPRGADAQTIAALERDGRLVRLVDSEYWIVGELDHSQPLVVPAMRDLLTDIGERFQARLDGLEAPRFRFEVSSVLRSAADQEELRVVNPNAALGESTHEYGTTVDVLYSAFAAPFAPIAAIDSAGATPAPPLLERYARVAAERLAARRAMELKAILGGVVLEVQREGRVMVTLERQQPVFHMTVAEAP